MHFALTSPEATHVASIFSEGEKKRNKVTPAYE